jgi:hypothetical protein
MTVRNLLFVIVSFGFCSHVLPSSDGPKEPELTLASLLAFAKKGPVTDAPLVSTDPNSACTVLGVVQESVADSQGVFAGSMPAVASLLAAAKESVEPFQGACASLDPADAPVRGRCRTCSFSDSSSRGKEIGDFRTCRSASPLPSAPALKTINEKGSGKRTGRSRKTRKPSPLDNAFTQFQ